MPPKATRKKKIGKTLRGKTSKKLIVKGKSRKKKIGNPRPYTVEGHPELSLKPLER